MLVQPRREAFRLVRQHDHALLAGALAGAWTSRADRPLSWPTVLAVSLHDSMWRERDHRPELDPATEGPRSFTALPAGAKAVLVEKGVEALEAVDPSLASTVRKHHDALREGRKPRGEARWVSYFDRFSLFLCLTGPEVDAAEIPSWLGPDVLREPPDGSDPLTVGWTGPGRLRLDPFPFAGRELDLAVPHRDLPRRAYGSAGDLHAAWDAAEDERQELLLAR